MNGYKTVNMTLTNS